MTTAIRLARAALRTVARAAFSQTTRLSAALALAAAIAAPGLATAQSQDPVREIHGDWEIRCNDASGRCYMMQVNTDPNGEPVLIMRLGRLGSPSVSDGRTIEAVAEVATGLNFYLPAGIEMRIDGGDGQRIPYARCSPNSCSSVEVRLPTDVVDRLKNGGEAMFSMMLSPERLVEARISLIGFTAAYNAL